MCNYYRRKIFLKNQLLSSIPGNPDHPVHDCARAYKSLKEVPLIMKEKKFSSAYSNNCIVKIKDITTNKV
jgi:hypothetical protein